MALDKQNKQENTIKTGINKALIIKSDRENPGRDITMDFAKGLAILLMVLDHIVAKGAFITSFHMPLFFFVSGYFLKEESIGITFKKKVKGIIVPYLEYGMLLCVVRSLYIVACLDYTWKESGYIFLVSLGNLLLVRNVFLLWFLVALFSSIMMYVIIQKLSRGSQWIKWATILLSLAFGGYLSRYGDQNLWYLDVACVSVIFVAAGNTYRKYQGHLSILIRFTVIAISGILWGIGIHNGGLVLALRKYPVFPLCVFAAIAGTIIVLWLSGYLSQIPAVGNVIAWCGRNTLKFLATSNLIRALLDWDKVCHGAPIAVQFVIQVVVIIVIIVTWNCISDKWKKKRSR